MRAFIGKLADASLQFHPVEGPYKLGAPSSKIPRHLHEGWNLGARGYAGLWRSSVQRLIRRVKLSLVMLVQQSRFLELIAPLSR